LKTLAWCISNALGAGPAKEKKGGEKGKGKKRKKRRRWRPRAFSWVHRGRSLRWRWGGRPGKKKKRGGREKKD